MKKLALFAAALFVTTMAAAQYPERPVTMVVPFAAGGPSDKTARDLAQAMQKSLGGTIIIENLGGGGGTIGANKVAKAKSDGYTLLFTHIGFATAPTLYRKMPYDTLNDFEYLGMVGEVPMTLVGRPTLAPNTYQELLPWLMANKSAVNLAHSGIGSASHLCGLLFQSMLQIPLATIPYKGTAPAVQDLVGSQVDLLCDQSTNTSEQIEGRKVKGYAVTSLKRVATPVLGRMPTLDESGLKGFNVMVWQGLYAPAKTPKLFTDKINAALRVALKDPEFIRRQSALGLEVISGERLTTSGHKKFVESEIARWAPVIKAAGQYAD